MATLQYTVWRTAAEVANGPVLNENIVTYTTSSVQSGALEAGLGGQKTVRVRIMSDADCWVNWGENPTALANGTGGRMMGAENPEYFDIRSDYLLAVIQRT